MFIIELTMHCSSVRSIWIVRPRNSIRLARMLGSSQLFSVFFVVVFLSNICIRLTLEWLWLNEYACLLLLIETYEFARVTYLQWIIKYQHIHFFYTANYFCYLINSRIDIRDTYHTSIVDKHLVMYKHFYCPFFFGFVCSFRFGPYKHHQNMYVRWNWVRVVCLSYRYMNIISQIFPCRCRQQHFCLGIIRQDIAKSLTR